MYIAQHYYLMTSNMPNVCFVLRWFWKQR